MKFQFEKEVNLFERHYTVNAGILCEPNKYSIAQKAIKIFDRDIIENMETLVSC